MQNRNSTSKLLSCSYSKAIKLGFEIMFMCVLMGCGDVSKEEYRLVSWPEGTNDNYAIEISHNNVSDVAIPDVQRLLISSQYVIGCAYWKYINGYYKMPYGLVNTNEFWFVLDKSKRYPKCYTYISTNKESWLIWCVSNNVPTNTINIDKYIKLNTSPSGGGAPKI
ncbi:MAG: hypothetical protein K9N48_07790 [Verrucomicrobia bacterium]|nr:hypothetical protein [Verrucomicrobiota bacterium]MCF7708029.1 hypothetical protein [Verrucomicrobiota bacterium]